MKKVIGWVTCEHIMTHAQSELHPWISRDDVFLYQECMQNNIEVVPLLWTEPLPERHWDAVLIRTPWDYALHQKEFLEWLHSVEQKGVPLWNPYDLLVWNSDKRYLQELARAGVTIVPSLFIEQGHICSLEEICLPWNDSDIVVKPTVGAGGKWTYRLAPSERKAFQTEWESLILQQGFMVQPFMDSILDEGEWSLHFFDGNYSHAVRKFPSKGEFRVQDDHGGSAEPGDAPKWLQEQARQVCEVIPYPWLYARVDGLVLEQQLFVMELELIEPELFFRADPLSAKRMLSALLERI